MKNSVETGTMKALREGPTKACKVAVNMELLTVLNCSQRVEGACWSQSQPDFGRQISFYYGFAVAWKSLLQHRIDPKLRKRIKALESLLGLIQNCSYDDPQSATLQDDVDRLRSKFKQVCSILSIQTDFRDYSKTSHEASF
ncbi:protein LTO1 homolog isoform X2 [Dunckerocampus dactyliophorus]|uniref:protein LTO1 homolog isoform X2 n=1 Tax=Dunckerocampus dactyliophorus TaxID=161453 RepID=UPI002404F47D|nr:protein LTO1 homolog isoform X2 [Dunckerocampus dactyliophorus]